MNLSIQKTVVALWSKPDPVLVGAGAAGNFSLQNFASAWLQSPSDPDPQHDPVSNGGNRSVRRPRIDR